VSRPRILVAGIGNVFLGDDGFGVEVAQRLSQRDLPAEACVVDFGIRGLDLAYALTDGYETVILVDAAPRGGVPGTVYLISPEAADPSPTAGPGPMLDMHALDPAKVLRLAAATGGHVRRLFLVGCEPARTDDTLDMHMGLSEPVQAAVDEGVRLVESLINRLLQNGEVCTSCPLP
jgi:hydrogenase maturation protease